MNVYNASRGKVFFDVHRKSSKHGDFYYRVLDDGQHENVCCPLEKTVVLKNRGKIKFKSGSRMERDIARCDRAFSEAVWYYQYAIVSEESGDCTVEYEISRCRIVFEEVDKENTNGNKLSK